MAETVRVRCLQQYGFGQFPYSVVFDKVDILGKTAHPLFAYMMGPDGMSNPNGAREKERERDTHTQHLETDKSKLISTPLSTLSLFLSGRAAISLNFEKFLLDSTGAVVRRYPRKYSGYQMERCVLMHARILFLSRTFFYCFVILDWFGLLLVISFFFGFVM